MTKCAIIGGGLAGLTSAVYLTKAGIKVKLYEASPKLGGRTYSFLDEESGDIIDNGQHLMMGCYLNTLEFLKIIDSLENVSYQKKLYIPFVDKTSGLIPLKAITTNYPFNLLIGLLKYRGVSIQERVQILRTISSLLFVRDKNIEKLSVLEWLKKEKQSPQAIKAFWEIIVVSALNSKIEDASAKQFVDILKQIFFQGNAAAAFITPGKGLSQVFSDKARCYIEKNGGEVFLSKPVDSIIIEDNNATGIKFKNEIEKNFDYVISAVPFYALEKIIDIELLALNKNIFLYNSILSAHIWLKENIFREEFYGLINSPVHWIFNKKNYITIVISCAEAFSKMGKEEILEIISKELKQYFPDFKNSHILRSKIIKEKRATFVSNNDIIGKRPGIQTPINNLMLAGDWVNIGLPATIEGAVKSGRIASEKLINFLEGY